MESNPIFEFHCKFDRSSSRPSCADRSARRASSSARRRARIPERQENVRGEVQVSVLQFNPLRQRRPLARPRGGYEASRVAPCGRFSPAEQAAPMKVNDDHRNRPLLRFRTSVHSGSTGVSRQMSQLPAFSEQNTMSPFALQLGVASSLVSLVICVGAVPSDFMIQRS